MYRPHTPTLALALVIVACGGDLRPANVKPAQAAAGAPKVWNVHTTAISWSLPDSHDDVKALPLERPDGSFALLLVNTGSSATTPASVRIDGDSGTTYAATSFLDMWSGALARREGPFRAHVAARIPAWSAVVLDLQ